ncbi:hypothetical protein KC614_04825, partial [candidate division WWE3 bacterium]|nr:hypothetical protein [candidate division WWE3 bacterium]
DDGSGVVRVYIKDSTVIDKPYMRVGYYARVAGIVSQYKDEYRILPRYQEDVVVSKSPLGSVLGSVTQLPETGNWLLGYSLATMIAGVALFIVGGKVQSLAKAVC